MKFSEYLNESKTYRDNKLVKLYHLSPEGDIKFFRPKVNNILKDEIVFFSPSYKSEFDDWASYVLYGKNKGSKDKENDKKYENLYLYTVTIPKEDYKKAQEWFEKKYEEDDKKSMGFWGWGSQIALTKDFLKNIKIIDVKKFKYEDIRKKQSEQNKNQYNSNMGGPKFDLTSLEKKPKNWLNDFHIELVKEIQKTKNEELKKLNDELIRIRTHGKNIGFELHELEPSKVDKEKFNKIKNQFYIIKKSLELLK